MRFANLSGGYTLVPQPQVAALRSRLHGQLLQQDSHDYDPLRRVFNGLFDRHPTLIARCADTSDVQESVRFAQEHQLLLSVRGGGHSIAGYGVCDDAMMIDLSLMREVRVDVGWRRAHVAGGALWSDVDQTTQRAGLATPGGMVSHTGVAGLTLGGGIGWLRNSCGLSCDNLLRAEVVTAAGEVLAASYDENQDLLWSLRGAGGNFGIVTSFEFALHQVGPQVAALFPYYRLQDAGAVLAQWSDWVAGTSREISSEVILWTVPDSAQFPSSVRGRPVAIPGAVYAGPVAHGRAMLRSLRTFADPLTVLGGRMNYCDVQSAFDASFPNTGELCSYWKSLYAQHLTPRLIEGLVQAAEERTSAQTMILVQHIGGAVRQRPSHDSAFAMRNAPFLINLMGSWRKPEESAHHIAWVRETWRRLAALGTATVYLNYMGEELVDGDALIRAAHGPNYSRLVAVKRRYDPGNLFRLNQNIAPQA